MATIEAEHVDVHSYRSMNHSNHVGMSLLATLGGAALVVLGALALYHIDRFLFLAIITLVAGLVLVIASGELAFELERASSVTGAEVGGGLNAGILGGVAGIVLGALGIVGILPGILSACAIIVFGVALLADFIGFMQLRSMTARSAESLVERPGEPATVRVVEPSSRIVAPTSSGANYSSALIAIALITLGIISLVWEGPIGAILIAIAFISFGGYFILSAASDAFFGYAVPMGRRAMAR